MAQSSNQGVAEARILTENRILRVCKQLEAATCEIEDLKQLTRKITGPQTASPFAAENSFFVQAGGAFVKQPTKDLYRCLERRTADLMNKKKKLSVQLDRFLLQLIKTVENDYSNVDPEVMNQLNKYHQRMEDLAEMEADD